MQAETAQTPDKPPAGDIASGTAPRRVSSKFIRREAARTAEDAAHAQAIAQRFAMLRTRILREMRNRDWKRLAVVPVTAGAGGTFVAVNLAIALARQQHTEVTLLDLALDKPAVARELGIPGCDLLSESLVKRSPIRDLLCTVEELPNLSVIAPERPEAQAAEILQDQDLATALAALGHALPANAVLLMDTAPLLGEDEALATLPLADAILLVADGRRGTAADMTHAERLLTGMPPVLGVILNKSED